MELTALDLLRQHTGEAHTGLERKLFVDRIMAGTLLSEQLIQLLQVNEHFLAAVEANAVRHKELAPFIVPRAHLAAADLSLLGAPRLSKSAVLNDQGPDGMRGALYVALGSLLGGALITTRLRAIQALPQGLAFYTEDREALAIWKSFTTELKSVTAPERCERVVHGALLTFELATQAVAAATSPQELAS